MKKQDILGAMAFIENASTQLGTTSHVWGGFTLDIYEGRFLREHSDIDYLTVDLLQLRPQLLEYFEQADWQVKTVINGDVVATRDGIELHLGDVYLRNRAVWTHNGKNGILTFPLSWLRKKAVAFCGIQVHVVEPEFEYVVKHFPALLNPSWQPREKDISARKRLAAILLEKNIDVNRLRSQVSDQIGA